MTSSTVVWIYRSSLAYLLYTMVLQKIIQLIRHRLSPSNPLLLYQKNGLGQHLLSLCKTIQSPYSPPIVWSFGLLSTILYPQINKARLTNQPEIMYQREVLNLEKFSNEFEKLTCCPKEVPSGEVSLDWTGATQEDAKSIYILVPGLTGSSSSYYISTFVRYVTSCTPSARVCAYNPRGRGGNTVTSNFLYSAGYTQDLRRIIQRVHNAANGVPIILVGYSLGGNVVAKFLGEEGEECLVDGAIVCSPPIDLLSMSNHLCHGIVGQIFDKALVYSCNQELSSDDHFAKAIHENRPSTMVELDGQIIAPMMGCESASHYYRVASAGLWLHCIATPTCFVLPLDDPIVNGNRVRQDDFAANKFLLAVITNSGGHSMDLPYGSNDSSWFAKAAVEFAEAVQSKIQ